MTFECNGTSTYRPLVSIVVVVFRDVDELLYLIDSISRFRSRDVELIVIDGGSDDGTLEVLKKNSERLDSWVSERDQGIYDAMNKGLSLARGTYILHINAGDRVLALPLAELRIQATQHADVVCCRVIEDGRHLFLPRNDWLLRFDNTWHHQGTFYLHSSHLGYDSTYRVFGDFDHNQRLRRANASVVLLDTIVSTHETNGASSNQEARHEVYRSIRTNFGTLHMLPAWARFQLLKLRKKIRGILGVAGS